MNKSLSFSSMLCAAALSMTTLAAPSHAQWVASWATAPNQPHPAWSRTAGTPSFQNRTLRQIVQLSAGGSALRLRLTNAYGTRALAFGGAKIALVDDKGQDIPGSSKVLTFSGAASAIAVRGAPLLSDAISFEVPALARVAITLYMPGDTGPCTCHTAKIETTQISPPGNFLEKDFVTESTVPTQAFLASVDVDAAADAATIVTVGDSITDGTASTPGANHRWIDFLAARLNRPGLPAWGVANAGIAGNRLLGDGASESALARFDRDVLSLPGVKAVAIFIGINDIGTSFGTFTGMGALYVNALADRKTDAAHIIAGYKQILARAHERGIKVYGATITPYKGADYFDPAGEAVRQEVNRFIRSGAFDAVFDFDRVWADPNDPLSINPAYHSGDHLHGSDAGYKALADSIDPGVFKK